MMLFHCALKAELDTIRVRGIMSEEGSPVWTSLEEARCVCREHILVIDSQKLSVSEVGSGVTLRNVPSGAILNLDPYLEPKPVSAAGGFVVRPGAGEPDVLVIFRRGVWDLPKGKLDAGETIEACALREVQEEVGIQDLHILAEAGTTMHGYEEKGAYMVKKTYWYLMQTSDTEFTPQQEEGIEETAWMPWSRARDAVGFETLRDKMDEVSERVRRVVAERNGTGNVSNP